MATTIAAAFRILKSNLEITDLQAATVSTRQQNVREAVEAEITVLDSFLAGSYMRNTLIAPLSDADVDIFTVLDPKYWVKDGQASLLDQVKRVLRKTYPKTPEISRNGQAVTITFTDFKVDVVPCFNRQGGGYLIPDSVLQRWIPTNPKSHIKIWSEANKAHNGDLIPVLKMLKCWNKRDAMSSFHLETVALSVLRNIRIHDHPSGVRYVFDKARDKIKYKLADPAGYSDDVAAHVNTQAKIDAIVSALDTAYTRARVAEKLAANNQAVFEKWRLIFGDYFSELWLIFLLDKTCRHTSNNWLRSGNFMPLPSASPPSKRSWRLPHRSYRLSSLRSSQARRSGQLWRVSSFRS